MKSFTRAVAAASSVLLGVGLFSAPLAAAAEEPAPEPGEVMGEYNASDYAAEAAQLEVGLVEALARDVDLTPEEYLAQSAAAVQAVEVVASLESAGVAVLGSRMVGTELVVNVPSEDFVPAVESAGAIAVLGEPEPLWNPEGLDIQPAEDLYDGQGWVWSDGVYVYQCSVGLNGYLVSSGARQLSTAGHCTDEMTAPASVFRQTAPGSAGTPGDTIGSVVPGTATFAGGVDVGRIAVGGSISPKSSALTWGGGAGAPLSSSPMALTGDAAPIEGSQLCKSGSRTGWTCGVIVDVDYLASVGGTPVRSVVSEACVIPGDSGGIGIVNRKAVGITSWVGWVSGTLPPPASRTCAHVAYSGYFQMVSPGGFQSVLNSYGSTWEMAASVSAPAISGVTSSGGSDTAINGTVPNAGRNYRVDIFIDGSTTPLTTASVNASTGAWTASVTAVPAGVHSFTAVARYGTWSKSSAASGFIKRGMTISRIEGADRYAVGVKIAQTAYPSGGAPVVYVTTGANYPDALSAAPAAAIEDGVLLLTASDALPAAVRAEIVRLAPARIVVVGGTNSVSSAVLADLKTIQSNTVRWAGADRFEASRTIVRNAFLSEQPSTAYIATGYNFPDALSASGAGGAFGYPVILVSGTDSTAGAATIQLLEDLGVTEIKIAGGPNSVSNGILNSLKVIDPTPTRLSGADRFEASANIAIDAFGTSNPTAAYIATGLNFPDALAGAPLAGANDAPLIVVRTECIPVPTMTAFKDFGTTRVTLLGGTASLNPTVQALKSC